MELKSYAAADGNNVRDLCLTFSVDRPMIQEEEHYSENQEVKQGLVLCLYYRLNVTQQYRKLVSFLTNSFI